MLAAAVQNRKQGIVAAPGFAKDPAIRFFVAQPRLSEEAVTSKFVGGPLSFTGARSRCSYNYGVSCARPLARRRFRTRRPAFVAMRARKPWVRARLILLGWKVRFICLIPACLLWALCRGEK